MSDEHSTDVMNSVTQNEFHLNTHINIIFLTTKHD